MKTITLYMLADKIASDKIDLNNWNIYTITSKMSECEEYLDKLLYLQHQDHFKLWCQVHNKDIDDGTSWGEYVLNLKDQLDEYTILKYKVQAPFISQIFRMYNGCTPLNCSYETVAEQKYFLDQLSKNMKKVDKN